MAQKTLQAALDTIASELDAIPAATGAAIGAHNTNELAHPEIRNKITGRYCGSYPTAEDVQGIYVDYLPFVPQTNDFVTVQDDSANGHPGPCRYVFDGINPADDHVYWLFDLAYDTDILGKIDKISPYVQGNIPLIDGGGGLYDSGLPVHDVGKVDKVNGVQPDISKNVTLYANNINIASDDATGTNIKTFIDVIKDALPITTYRTAFAYSNDEADNAYWS